MALARAVAMLRAIAIIRIAELTMSVPPYKLAAAGASRRRQSLLIGARSMIS